jgi:adenylylsulfate kinase-like enzyme
VRLRCHLLIGPPASGKTTLAGVLAELTDAVVLSTDVVRQELFGDAAVQGPWRDIEALLHQRIREAVASGTPVILLDGDDLRSGLCADLGFSDADRSENLRRAAHLARLLTQQGNTVICAFVTPKEHHRALVREILGEHVRFIHIDCPLEVCVARDVKGLYAKAAAQHMSDMSGTQDGFETPTNVQMSIRTDQMRID